MIKQRTIAQESCHRGSVETQFECQNLYVQFWYKSTQYEAEKLLVMELDIFRLAEALNGPGLLFSWSTKNLIGKSYMKEGVRGGGVNVTR